MTKDFSKLNTEPVSLIHLASDFRCRFCLQASLLAFRLGFGQVGFETVAVAHLLTGNNQFLPRPELSRFRIYLCRTGNILTKQPL